MAINFGDYKTIGVVLMVIVMAYLALRKDTAGAPGDLAASATKTANSPRRGYGTLDYPPLGGECQIIYKDLLNERTGLYDWYLRNRQGKEAKVPIHIDMLTDVSLAENICSESPPRYRLKQDGNTPQQQRKAKDHFSTMQTEMNALRSEKFNHISNETRRVDEILDRFVKMDSASQPQQQGGYQQYRR